MVPQVTLANLVTGFRPRFQPQAPSANAQQLSYFLSRRLLVLLMEAFR